VDYPAPIRQRLRKFLTPKIDDYVVYETQETARTKTPPFGTLHRDQQKYPGFRFAYAVPKDEQGNKDTWIYVAPRKNQDDYNWEWTEADIGGTKFSAIRRTYVTLRDDFLPYTPAQGAAMPNTPAGKFSNASTYRLAERTQQQIGDEELASIFVVDVQTFARTVPLTNNTLSPEQGRSKASTTVYYCRGDVVPNSGGMTIEALAANPNNSYWGRQMDDAGTYRELASLSENWFAITESTSIAGDGSGPGTGNPSRNRSKIYPTPSVLDYIVKEVVSDPDNIPYGTAHYDTTNYPNHVLSFKRPTGDPSGLLYEFFYTAPRADQDAYNFEITGDDVVVRTYVFTRASYLAESDAIPEVGTPDPAERLDGYGYTHYQVVRTEDQELDGVFIAERRYYQKISKSKRELDSDLDRDIETTTEFITKGSNTLQSIPGRSVAIDTSHTQYDFRTTTRIVPRTGDSSSGGILVFPVELTTIIGDTNYDFPPLLEAVEFPNRWAFASNGDVSDYAEDFVDFFKTKEPNPGPYEMRTLRILTDDPVSIRNLFPITPRAVPQREVIYVGSQYAIASPEQVKAHASLQQLEVPPTIHPEIIITPPDSPATIIYTEKLPATQGYTAYAGLAILTVGARTLLGPMSTFIVEVMQINAGGAYSGQTYEWGAGSISSGLTGNTGQIPPVITTVEANATNTQAVGSATPDSVIRIYSGSGPSAVEEGRGASDVLGNFSVALNPVRTNPFQLYATARRAGLLSPPVGFMTNDLAPVIPTASLNPIGLASLVGFAEPGSTVTIALAPVEQELEITVSGTATSTGSIIVRFAAAVFGATSPIERAVGIVSGDTSDIVAGKIVANLLGSSPIAANWEFSIVGSVITATRKSPDMNDGTALLSITDNIGIASSSSTVTVLGRGTVTVTASPTDGGFFYTFSPPLSDGDTIEITASDAGGTSPALNLIADAATPDAPDYARFPTVSDDGAAEYDRIVGDGDPGVTVVAALNGVVKGTDVSDGGGLFSIDLDKGYVSGEVFSVYAYITGSPGKRSPDYLATAYNLNLPVPVLGEDGTLIFGTLPASALALADVDDIEVVVRYEADAGSEKVIDIFANLEWNFDILTEFSLDAPPQNGQRFEVFYRFPQADGKAAIKAFPRVEIPTPSFAWASPLSIASGPQLPPFQCAKVTSVAYADSWTSAFSPFLTEWYRSSDTTFSRPIKSPTFGLSTATSPIDSGPSYLYPGTNGTVLAARAPYMGPGTKVVIRFPGSSKPTQEIIWSTAPDVERPAFDSINAGTGSGGRPAIRAANVGEYATISVANWTNPAGTPAWGDGKPSDPYMTVANLKLVIPPVLDIYVEAPDGRTITVTQPRSSVSPFMV
jgi:hypothetical protein